MPRGASLGQEIGLDPVRRRPPGETLRLISPPHVMLGQLSELFRNASEFGEHNIRVADCIAPEPGSYRVHGPIHGPAGRTGRSTGPVAVAAEAERQL